MKKIFSALLFEMIPVMLGVYLGFVISEWSKDRDRQNQTEIFQNNIVAELESNHQKIADVIIYHEMLRDSARHFAYHHQPTIRFFKGIRTITLNNSAYETGIQTGLINELRIEKLQELNQVYNLQKSYADYAAVLLTGILNMEFSQSESARRKLLSFLAITMTDVAIKERALLEEYEAILETMSAG